MSFLWAACILLAAAIFLPDDGANAAPIAILCVGGPLCIAAAVCIEVEIRSQLRLARFGLVAEATVIETRTRRNRNGDEYGSMRYCFATADGRSIETRRRLSYFEAAYIQANSRVMVAYHADRPTRNQPIDHLWAVQRNDSAES